MKTQSACLTGIGRIETRERELTIGPDEVLVKTHLAGICGSDKNLYNGIIPPSGGLNTEMRTVFAYPYFLGHEGGGTVVAVGAQVQDLAVGDRVISFGWIETIAEYFKGREEDLQKVPAGMEMDLACLGEPIGCAVFSGLMSKIQFGDVVAIFGMGFAGQIMAQVAKAKGAYKVIGVDVVDGKLELARKLGLDHAVNSAKADPLKAVMEITHGLGADVVVDMAGSADSVNLCTAAVKHNGIMVFYSWITQDITVNISRWHNNSLEVINTGLVHHGIAQRTLWTPLALRPVIQGQLAIAPLITHRFPISKVAEAFAVAAKDPAAIKVVIEFP
ncbi:MAG: zinc-binding dehydrogenase [Deltaproteobacteria bacterium]|nr:zinc-binding dehydrogenase [Deltaproteobacteria bacterium]